MNDNQLRQNEEAAKEIPLDEVKSNQIAVCTDAKVADDTVDFWAAKITTALATGTAWVVHTGVCLNQAKQKLGHGRWEQLLRGQLGFGLRTAQVLMSIARNPCLRKAQNHAFLPPSAGTLIELARGNAEIVQRGIDDREIHPEMSTKQAKAFIRRHTASAVQRRPLPVFDPVKRLAAISRFMIKEITNWPEDQMDELVAGMQKLCQQIQDGEMPQAVPTPSSQT